MGLRWNRNLVRTLAMRILENLVKSMVNTSFHPCGTAAMLPREYGGVVDVDLKLYGVRNLRVIDSSIIPLIANADLQSIVYALAEKVDHSSLSCS
ncbi:GMC oxidoreductase-domain-containing protein [Truncatella angustata]|uniref:GMC oxidoreductase-domain-containing protein n=1 Tax=Truncatella angustata TaxID=152316 RepID=A0A9P8ZUC7_9PEZI|nr:GMC oxidoreductase-domain-containing protein [Truncatella angustata]KAH6648213.1 GMC oxidoreductase-domain-containing protein [Truncatella angustata]